MNEITVQQIQQLYKMNIIDIHDCAYIFGIQPMSVYVKFTRLKNGDLNRTILHPGEKKRLVERLQEPIQLINSINSVLQTNNHQTPEE
jgi:hypothetical protein